MSKTSEAQKKASRTWEQKNRRKATIAGYKRTARTFIRNHATIEDLEELRELINNKENELNQE